jgi:hypothetical protein
MYAVFQMDERDYDRRLSAYPRLNPSTWASMSRLQALPLVHQALADLRDADDLALRHAASRALADLITAAAAAAPNPDANPDAPSAPDDAAANDGGNPGVMSDGVHVGVTPGVTPVAGVGAGQRSELGLLVQRVLFPQIKRSLGASNLAVRQVRAYAKSANRLCHMVSSVTLPLVQGMFLKGNFCKEEVGCNKPRYSDKQNLQN